MKLKNKEGISLIALVITIVIMIILVGIIILALNDSDIIERADDAVEKTGIAQMEQLAQVAWTEAYADGKKTQAELETAVIDSLRLNGYADIALNNYDINVTTEGVEITKSETISSEWDYEWDYTKGLIEDYGFMEKEVFGESATTMTDGGERLSAQVITTSTMYLRLNSKISTCTSGIVQVKFGIGEFRNGNVNGVEGFRVLLSNGTSGLQIAIKNQSLYYQTDTTLKWLATINAHEEYVLKLVYNKAGVNEVYLNGALIYSTTTQSTLYCKTNTIFQQNGGHSYLKEVKYKFNINGEV